MRIASTYLTETTKFKALFDLICNPIDKTKPIHCAIPRWAYDEYNEACKFYTRGELEIVGVKKKKSSEEWDLLECKSSKGYFAYFGA